MAMTHNDEPQDEEVYINESDGLPRAADSLLLQQPRGGGGGESLEAEGDGADDRPPRSLIVTNVRADVFEDERLRADMEALFRAFAEPPAAVAFVWLRSFRRLRVDYADARAAMNARIGLHRYAFPPPGDAAGEEGGRIGCYFAQPVTPAGARELLPPKPDKQFLISPPSSPPVGWEPRPEHEPLVNRDLLAALARLEPGCAHELVPPMGGQPAIVVHAARARAADNQQQQQQQQQLEEEEDEEEDDDEEEGAGLPGGDEDSVRGA